MSSSFKQRIVFGLLVLCVFYFFPTEARFNLFPKKSISNTFHQQQQQQQMSFRLSSETLNLRRNQPLHALQSTSMETVNLRAPSSLLSSSSSSSNIHRSASSPTINNANSPALMQESSSLHRQAAISLNLGGAANIHRENTIIQRLRPRLESMNAVAKYVKNGAIGVAGAGGIASLVRSFSNGNSERASNV